MQCTCPEYISLITREQNSNICTLMNPRTLDALYRLSMSKAKTERQAPPLREFFIGYERKIYIYIYNRNKCASSQAYIFAVGAKATFV